MITIRLIDARRGLSCKCRELFKNERIADEIYRYLCDGLEECENAEPERENGKWIEHDDWYGVYYECSVCKEPFTLIDGTPQDNLYNFCPNCGAEMRGENDGE